MSTLIVYLNAERVGRLERDESGSIRFAYDQAWLEWPGAVPLSRSLPLERDVVFSGKKARPFFAGILPEEGPRMQIAKILGISDSNDFAMLERIGGECAGAVSLHPEGAAPPDSGNTERRDLTEHELKQIVAELPRRPLLAGTAGLRLSLAGVQDKLPVIVDDNKITLPLGNTFSTHILKPEWDHFPGLAANELFCMTLAKAIGLNVPDTVYRPVGDKSCILVQRFDRETTEGGVTLRLHQEDFCQALGFPPEHKYQAEGGPTLHHCITLLREWSTAPVLDIPTFINGLIFNVLIGNADAHGKNHALLYSRGGRRMAPFYDLVSTTAWPELSTKLSMKIGDCESVNAFTIGDWKKMATTAGLGWPMIRERMGLISRAVLSKLDSVQFQIKECNEEVAEQLHAMIGHRSARMLESLSKSDR